MTIPDNPHSNEEENQGFQPNWVPYGTGSVIGGRDIGAPKWPAFGPSQRACSPCRPLHPGPGRHASRHTAPGRARSLLAAARPESALAAAGRPESALAAAARTESAVAAAGRTECVLAAGGLDAARRARPKWRRVLGRLRRRPAAL